MGRKTQVTNTVLKGHRTNITIEAPIRNAAKPYVGGGRTFANWSHFFNLSGKEKLESMGVKVEE